MLKLEPVSAEPFWLDVLPGVRIQFRPVSVAAMLIARGAAGEALKAGGEQATIEAGAAFTRALAQTGIVAGEGIGDAKGKPVIATMVYKYRESADVTPHDWCGYCRRPTIFMVSRRGPKRAGNMILPPTEVKNRCTLCGSSEEIMNLRFPEMNQRWDLVNRVKLTTNVVRSDK